VDGFSQEEKRNLGSDILGLNQDEHLNGSIIVDELYRAYQTPMGYIVRTPDFKDICLDVAGKFVKISKETAGKDCWTILSETAEWLFQTGMEKMTDDQRVEFVNRMREAATDAKTSSGTALASLAILQSTSPVVVHSSVAAMMSSTFLGSSAVIGPVAIGLPILWPLCAILLIPGINNLFGTSWAKVIPAVFWIAAYHKKGGTTEA
jgi:hypothetical protein